MKKQKKLPPVISTSYLSSVYYPELYKKKVKKVVDAVKLFKKKHGIDAIAFTGTSGAAYAYPVSLAVELPLICVRKGSSHYGAGAGVEGCVSAKKYIIIDDFICSGATIRRIMKMVKKKNPLSELKGIFLYSEGPNKKFWKEYPVFCIR